MSAIMGSARLLGAAASRQLTAGGAIKLPSRQIGAGTSMRPYDTKSAGFSWQGMKKHYAVLPLVFLIGGTFAALGCYIVYGSMTRADILWSRTGKTRSEKIDLLAPAHQKMRVINQQYRPLSEVHQLYKEMSEASAEAEE